MFRKSLSLLVMVCLFSPARAQSEKSALQESGTRFQDDALGVTFAASATPTKIDGASYSIQLHSASAQVSATDRLFIDLPGSYGGRLYLDAPSASRFVENRLQVDSVRTDYVSFRREYWAVYAGMGMWDCVINCTTQRNGRFYIVSLVQERPLGKPGEAAGGSPLTAEALKVKALGSLRDTTDVAVMQFDALLSSVQIHNER